MKTTFDRTVYSLCLEIDELKKEVDYWREKYEEERRLSIQSSNERLEQSKKEVANALLFCLSVKDDKDGNLIISKKDRKTLSKSYKK